MSFCFLCVIESSDIIGNYRKLQKLRETVFIAGIDENLVLKWYFNWPCNRRTMRQVAREYGLSQELDRIVAELRDREKTNT